MKSFILITAILFSSIISLVYGQQVEGRRGGRPNSSPQEHNPQQRDAYFMKGFEQFKAEKTAFLTKEAQLTPEEAGKVFPIYDELQGKRFELNRKVRTSVREKMRSESNPTPQGYEWAAEELFTLSEKEAKIDRECYDRLKVILPAEKLFKLRVAEDRFMRHMMRKFESKPKPGEK